MEKRVDVAALGELLIDFTQYSVSENGMRLFEQNPGGAPANLLTTVSHMGYMTAMIGKVGADMHGDFLKGTLQQEGICTDYILQDDTVFTTLAFVEINKEGERHFSFARKPGADTCLLAEELNPSMLQACKIFHIGSLSLTDEPAKTATMEAVKIAKKAGALISYDPNYRKSLWKNEQEAVDTIKSVIPYADMMKVSEEESILITGALDYQEAAKQLLSKGPKLIAVTLGSEGVYLISEKYQDKISGFTVKAVDTTGAGDSFWGGFLSCFLDCRKAFQKMSWEEWKSCARYGNAVASLCVQKRGGIPAIPDKKEVECLLK